MAEPTRPGLRRYAALCAAATLLLILAGGFVTTTRSGDAIPTWPLTWGRLVPPDSRAAVWIEQSHRYVAGIVGLLVLGLAVAARRRLAWIAFGGVLAQALLGAGRIFFPKESQTLATGTAFAIVHACFGQLVFVAVSGVALLESAAWSRLGPDEAAGAARKLGVVTSVFAFLQLVAGAVTRHTGAGIAVHLVGAMLVVLHAVLLSNKLAPTSLKRGANVLVSLVALQVLLGLAAWSMTGQAAPSTGLPLGHVLTVSGHVVVGASVLVTCVLLTAAAFRCHRALPQGGGALEPGGA